MGRVHLRAHDDPRYCLRARRVDAAAEDDDDVEDAASPIA